MTELSFSNLHYNHFWYFVNKVKLVPVLRNIVATIDMKRKFDLNKLTLTIRNSIYEPEQFPGLIAKITKQTSLTFLIFSSGKIVIVGAKSEEELNESTKHMIYLILQYGSIAIT